MIMQKRAEKGDDNMHRTYENIRILRVTKGWTQQELAEKMGYTDKSMISKIEKGKVDLTLSKVEDFAEIFGTTPAQLMGLEDEMDETTIKIAKSLTRIMEYSEKGREEDTVFLPSKDFDREKKSKNTIDASELFQKRKTNKVDIIDENDFFIVESKGSDTNENRKD